MDPDELLSRLRATPGHLRRAATGRTDAELRRPPAPKAWSLNEVLAHLLGSADVQGGWITRMLSEDGPTIRYASPRTGMRKGGYAERPFAENLRTFTEQRAALVERLDALTEEDWERSATFTGTTKGWAPTVHDLATGIANHEHSHFDQIDAATATPSAAEAN